MLYQVSVDIAGCSCRTYVWVMLQPDDVMSTFTNTITSGVWAEMMMLADPEFRQLAKSLPSTVLGRHADSTAVKYGYAFQHWKAWANLHLGVAVFPISEVHFALYLQD